MILGVDILAEHIWPMQENIPYMVSLSVDPPISKCWISIGFYFVTETESLSQNVFFASFVDAAQNWN